MAEVLITLVIVGIIASITVPVIYTNAQKHAYLTQLKKSYSTLQNGFKMIESIKRITLGKIFETNSDETTLFEIIDPLFKKVFNITRSYKPSEVTSTSTGLLSGDSCSPIGKEYISGAYLISNKNKCVIDTPGNIFVFSDGMIVDVERYIVNDVRGGNQKIVAEVSVDVNGLKGPNTFGYDVFDFLLLNTGELIPAGGLEYAKMKGGENGYKSYHWKTGTGYTCVGRTGGCSTCYGSGCSAQIIESGWVMDY